jgi:curved DNA-binding protein CbpA
MQLSDIQSLDYLASHVFTMNTYELLEVPFNASHTEIKAAYRRAVKKHHPDVAGNNDNETIILINQAYELLTDPERRKKYDSAPVWTYEVPVMPDARTIYKKEFLARKQAQALASIEFEKRCLRRCIT